MLADQWVFLLQATDHKVMETQQLQPPALLKELNVFLLVNNNDIDNI